MADKFKSKSRLATKIPKYSNFNKTSIKVQKERYITPEKKPPPNNWLTLTQYANNMEYQKFVNLLITKFVRKYNYSAIQLMNKKTGLK